MTRNATLTCHENTRVKELKATLVYLKRDVGNTEKDGRHKQSETLHI